MKDAARVWSEPLVVSAWLEPPAEPSVGVCDGREALAPGGATKRDWTGVDQSQIRRQFPFLPADCTTTYVRVAVEARPRRLSSDLTMGHGECLRSVVLSIRTRALRVVPAWVGLDVHRAYFHCLSGPLMRASNRRSLFHAG